MATTNITQKVAGSDTYNERKILADDVNQIREAIQTGAKDIKPNNVQMVGNTITADNGSNWIRRNNNTFQYHNGSAWVEPTTANLLTFTAGENIAARDVVYLKVADGKIYKASTTNNDWIGVATAAITSGASGTIYPNGSLVGGFSGLTSGNWYGLNATAGTLTANENYIVGLAISATQIILVKPKGDMSTRDNALYKLQGEKAINDVSATNSGVLAGSSQVLIDKFLDATGQNNTVDTGNTTAIYDSMLKAYICNQNVILNSNFTSLNNWTYSETDPDYQDYGITGGGRKIGSGGNTDNGSYCQILQSVDFSKVDSLQLKISVYNDYSATQTLMIYVGGTQVYGQNFQSIALTEYDIYIDCSSFTGTQDLIIRNLRNTTGGASSNYIIVKQVYPSINSGYIESNILSNIECPSNLIYPTTKVSTSTSYTNFYYRIINSKLYKLTATLKTDSGGAYTCYLNTTFYYSDNTSSSVEVSTTGNKITETKNIINPFTDKTVLKVAGSIKNLGGNSSGHNVSNIYAHYAVNGTKIFITAPSTLTTAQISFDEGSTYNTVSLNTWESVPDNAGINLILKLVLDTDGTTTPQVSGWRVLLE